MGVKRRESNFFKLILLLAALSSTLIMIIGASGQDNMKNATRLSSQSPSIKKNASFATNFRNKGNTQTPRPKVSCAKEIDLANSK